jgi:chromate transporter
LATLFLKQGAISFGGPAAHIALIEAEIVRKRQWVTRQQFLDMLGAANLIPGPTSTEMAINVGFVQAGWIGLCVAGASFIIPAALITGAFAWAYVRFGTLTQAVSALGGIKAAVIAVIAIAIWRLGRTAVKNVGLAALGVISLAAFFLGVNPIAILFGGGLLGMLGRRLGSICGTGSLLFSASSTVFSVSSKSTLRATFLRSFGVAALASSAGDIVDRPSIVRIGLFFLKVGAVLYGGGYVLLAFLEQGLVRQHAWLTQQQLLDAVAIGQFTPGPVLSTATFIGYILGGVPGAAVATVGIFLPSFFYVALLAHCCFIERIRMDGGVSRLGECVRGNADERGYVPTGGGCLAGLASLGDCPDRTRRVAALESEPGLGGVRRWDGRAFVGGASLRVVLCESNRYFPS